MEIAVREKRMNLGVLEGRFTAGEREVDTITLAAARYYNGLDLAELSFLMEGINEQGGMAVSELEKQVDGPRLCLRWRVGAAFTALPGALQLQAVGIDGEGTRVIKFTGNPVTVRAGLEPGPAQPPLSDQLEALLRSLTGQALLSRDQAQAAAEQAQAAAGQAQTAAGQARESSLRALEDAAKAEEMRDASAQNAHRTLENLEQAREAARAAAFARETVLAQAGRAVQAEGRAVSAQSAIDAALARGYYNDWTGETMDLQEMFHSIFTLIRLLHPEGMSWQQFEELNLRWDGLQAQNQTWEQLENWNGGNADVH